MYLQELTEDPTAVMKISGALYNKVRTVYNDITHFITIFNISGRYCSLLVRETYFCSVLFYCLDDFKSCMLHLG